MCTMNIFGGALCLLFMHKPCEVNKNKRSQRSMTGERRDGDGDEKNRKKNLKKIIANSKAR